MVYEIDFDKHFDKSIDKEPGFHKYLKKFNTEVIPNLVRDPFNGKNIKKLKGDLEGLYRYRVGNYRIFYTVNIKTVVLIEVVARKDAY